jgi:sec-independent protein translocase protein TatA
MPNLGAPELIIVLIIVLLVFGGAKLPKLARSLGEAKNEFEKTAKSSPSTDAAAATPVVVAAPAEPSITMTKAEYDALLAERNAANKD